MAKVNFWNDEDIYRVILASVGGMSAMFTKLDLLLKILIAIATLFYLCLKIIKELKNGK